MCKPKVFYEVLTEEKHEFFTSDIQAYRIFRTMVERNKDCAVDKITITKKLFRKPLLTKECILDFEGVENNVE